MRKVCLKRKPFGAKLKEDIIKNRMIRLSTMETNVCTAINASDKKIGSILKASSSSGDKLDIVVDKASSSNAKIDQVLKTC